jgi:hypothetical protein
MIWVKAQSGPGATAGKPGPPACDTRPALRVSCRAGLSRAEDRRPARIKAMKQKSDAAAKARAPRRATLPLNRRRDAPGPNAHKRRATQASEERVESVGLRVEPPDR